MEKASGEPRVGLDDAAIPCGSEEFQSKLFHLICVLLQAIRNASSPKELEEAGKYLLPELTVICVPIVSHAQSKRLLLLHSRNRGEEAEADFLSFLTFFSFAQITQISPVCHCVSVFRQRFPSVLLSESRAFLHAHLPLFIQLVYHWEMGEQLLRVALKQVARFLDDPAQSGGSEEASLMHVSMPVKKQRIAKSSQKEAKKTKKNSKSKSKSKKQQQTESEVETSEAIDEKSPDLVLSLEQSIDILEAVLNDTITQTSSYEESMIADIVDVLKKVVVSLQSFLFSDIESTSETRSHASLEAFYRLLALQFHVEMHINVRNSLEKAKQNAADSSWIDKQASNPLLGSIPRSMAELCTILRREILPFNEAGGASQSESSLGCYCVSLLHLLLVHSTKCASLLLFDEQVEIEKQT